MKNRCKVPLVALGLILLITLGLPSKGQAQGIIFGDHIPTGQVVDNNLILNGTDINIEGTVNGDVIAFGDTITLSGLINGSFVAFGNTIVINGQVTNSVLSGGIRLELEPGSEIGRDLYFAGARLTLFDDSSVQRDLNCVSLEAEMTGAVGRDTSAIIGPLQIIELMIEPVRERITIIGQSIQGYTSQAGTSVPGRALAGLLVPGSRWIVGETITSQQPAQVSGEDLKTWGTDLLRNLVGLLVVGLLGIWLAPMPLNWAAEKIHKQTRWVALSGIIFFISGWFLAILALALVVMLALFLLSISLPNLGFMTGTLGLTGVGLGVSTFWLSITYVSKIIFALLAGRLILQRLLPAYAQGNFWPLLLGTILYALIASIPILGWVVATVVTFLGLGALWTISYPRLAPKETMDNPPAVA